MTDITLLTDARYVNPSTIDWYVQNILEEDRLVTEALQKRGLSVTRTNWDNTDYDWTKTRFAVFRATWDYFDRFQEFSRWLTSVNNKTNLINPLSLVKWNMDKHYLRDLKNRGINVPPTLFIEPGEIRSLAEIVKSTGWNDCILKPAVSGAARHTYKLNAFNVKDHETIFRKLIDEESMLIQEFQHQITTKGEVALMVFGGKFSHAVLKKAKAGDFRVQDDFGGTVHEYLPSPQEIEFAEHTVSTCSPFPVYARVDLIWDNQNNLSVSELELIEPELWFRKHLPAAEAFAEAILKKIEK
jgi:glutathione synthase/RimK-type ligase-like ATP-grasp enzyme